MFDGVKASLFASILTLEKVVGAILDGMRRKRALVQLPGIVRWLNLFKGRLPPAMWDWVAKATGVSTSMKLWRGRAGP